MSSTCYNPFLYAWLNENFRKEFKQVLPCFGTSSSTLSSMAPNRTASGVTRQRNSLRSQVVDDERYGLIARNDTVNECTPLDDINSATQIHGDRPKSVTDLIESSDGNVRTQLAQDLNNTKCDSV